MPITQRHKEYAHQYVRDKYDRIGLTVPKGMKDEIIARATQLNMSTNQYITNLILSDLSSTTTATPPDPDVSDNLSQMY